MANDVSINIEVPQAELNEVSRIIQLRAGHLRESMRESTLWAAWFIARAAGASTVNSPKLRPVKKNPLRGQRTENGKIWWSAFVAVRKFSKKTIAAGGSEVETYIPLGTLGKADAQNSRARKISKRGLAKRAWAWAVGEMRGTTPSPGKRSWRGYGGDELMEMHQTGGAHNPTVTMHNKLSYAAFAMKSEKVPSIISRGMNAMRKDLERRAHIAIARTA